MQRKHGIRTSGINKPSSIRTLFETIYSDSMGVRNIDDLISDLCPYEFAYILHDKDYHSSGELKKPHYHIYLKWLTPQNHDIIRNKLGLNNEHIITTARLKKACLQYMLHITTSAKQANKHQYQRSELITNIQDINSLLVNSSELAQSNINLVIDIINKYRFGNTDGYINYEALFIELADKDLIDFYNKYYNSVFKRLV